ncbi:MAG: hypothetical protein QXN16_02825 [Candidatus Micrarchaeaceae archaeon]
MTASKAKKTYAENNNLKITDIPNSKYLSKPTKRKVQVLEEGKGFCWICEKETKQSLVYVFKKTKMPIPLIIAIVWRTAPAFYGIVCNNCGTVLARMKNEAELSKKYGRSVWNSSHKIAKEEPKMMELRFIQFKPTVF